MVEKLYDLFFFFLDRCKKRLSILLHTHVALIGLCTLSVLDAGCVIGQIISDILIMKGKDYNFPMFCVSLINKTLCYVFLRLLYNMQYESNRR